MPPLLGSFSRMGACTLWYNGFSDFYLLRASYGLLGFKGTRHGFFPPTHVSTATWVGTFDHSEKLMYSRLFGKGIDNTIFLWS